MLSDEEIARIQQTERYKYRAIQELEAEQSRKFSFRKFFSFFNSKFGLWLLSAIFISGGVKVYDDYKVKRDNHSKWSEKVEQLDNEISYKLSRLLMDLQLADQRKMDVGEDQLFSSMDQVGHFILDVDRMDGTRANYLYPDYQNWNLLALIAEQNRLLNLLGKRDPELEVVLGVLSESSRYFEDKQVHFDDLQEIRSVILEMLILPRWKSNRLFSH